jgi:NitT/TauT family transport system substrate-binding protein
MRSSARSWIWIAEDYANVSGFFTQAGGKVPSNASGRGNNVPALRLGRRHLARHRPGLPRPQHVIVMAAERHNSSHEAG